MVVNVTKIFQMRKKINWLGIEKNVREWKNKIIKKKKEETTTTKKKAKKKKRFIVIIRNICFKNKYLESAFDQGYKDVSKNQFWNYKFTLESWFIWKKEREIKNYKLRKL